jgi:hypothetical protein
MTILDITTALMSMRLELTRIYPQGYQVILLHLHLTNSLNFCFSFVLRSVLKVISMGNQALHCSYIQRHPWIFLRLSEIPTRSTVLLKAVSNDLYTAYIIPGASIAST